MRIMVGPMVIVDQTWKPEEDKVISDEALVSKWAAIAELPEGGEYEYSTSDEDVDVIAEVVEGAVIIPQADLRILVELAEYWIHD